MPKPFKLSCIDALKQQKLFGKSGGGEERGREENL
jgi:hypothetical protein